ncbi:Ubiquitin carboxyl-terminal hydrolase 47 [Homalodisca vitripennis]|nr:Ubiquitin carboxyl-terminal hydrolase 47 [Homalodisca vitripennis]
MKTYGGGALRGYYSGAYSSSTNAYMLMYRQINDDNCDAIKVQDFPPHIKELYSELKEKQETDRRIKDRHLEMIKLKVYCEHPSKGMTDVKIYVHNDSTFGEVTSRAYESPLSVSMSEAEALFSSLEVTAVEKAHRAVSVFTLCSDRGRNVSSLLRTLLVTILLGRLR